ncbi:hypothetical protein ACE1CI_02100 [Aerosakkonemataceae cyanobacterium BLCC-F50]|uniref:Uncharacterized protein n=1 Tax=Floridaenema flaviceps BLCC-F50 TaxID=3153642 RepID=A0ABV4XJ25_9CYAN
MMRWENYLMKHGKEFITFWEELLSERERNLLFVLGLGFDPRMCQGLETILKVGGRGKRTCLLIEFDEGANSPSKDYADLVQVNFQTLNKLLDGRGSIKRHPLQMWSNNGQLGLGSQAYKVFKNLEDLAEFTDVIVDISAIPKGIYLSIIAKLLALIDFSLKDNYPHYVKIPNLHVLVSENISLDRRIQQQGLDEKATYLHGFSGDIGREGTPNVTKIWFPVLGEGKITQLRRIHDYLDRPSEICPVIPSPSINPRRGDTLLLQEYRSLLFDELKVEPRNIIYASEQNPFEAYRQLYRTIFQYSTALEVLGGCNAFISPLSSKLLSIGSLLAAYEIKQDFPVGIIHVESRGYQMLSPEEKDNESELFTLWLAGECYEE